MIPCSSPCRYDYNSVQQQREEMQAHRQLHPGCPVVWRWVPAFSDDVAAAGVTRSSSAPRVIHATAQEPMSFPASARAGILRKAHSTFSPIVIPEVPTFFTMKAPMMSNNSANTTRHGELEVAALLLNMGGGGSGGSRINSNNRKRLSSTSAISVAKSTTTAASATSSALEDKYLDAWVGGSVSLHTVEDDDVLSPLHCFMRKHCVEAFAAEDDDVLTPRYGKSHGFKVEVGQVGIRCLHCKDQSPGKRAERAVCYPSSLRNIYHSIETWQRRHSLVCKRITPWVKQSIIELMESSKTRAGGRRQYWEDSARWLGMVDTSQGVRFSRKPGYLRPTNSLHVKGGVLEIQTNGNDQQPQPVVRQEDKDLVTEYLFLLMAQMQTCCFTESDRTGGRSKIKDNQVGFPGMECRHCQGRAGFGRYFPNTVSAFSLANSDRNVYNHLQKCRKCPVPIKSELNRLQKDQTQSKNRRGLRKLFFNRVWGRMHDNSDRSKKIHGVRIHEPTTSSTRMTSSLSLPSAMMPFSSDKTHSMAVNNNF